MDETRREKREHGTQAFPFQIYPALDGSEADDSDFIPYHWHPEPEIITVDAGRVSLTIADHVYEGEHGGVFFAAGEELHEIRTAGRENQFRSFVFAADFLQFARADQVETKLLAPLAEGRLRLETNLRAGENGQRGGTRVAGKYCACLYGSSARIPACGQGGAARHCGGVRTGGAT